jgi:hypothetical protein
MVLILHVLRLYNLYPNTISLIDFSAIDSDLSFASCEGLDFADFNILTMARAKSLKNTTAWVEYFLTRESAEVPL